MAVNDEMNDEDWGAWGKKNADISRSTSQSPNKDFKSFKNEDKNFNIDSDKYSDRAEFDNKVTDYNKSENNGYYQRNYKHDFYNNGRDACNYRNKSEGSDLVKEKNSRSKRNEIRDYDNFNERNGERYYNRKENEITESEKNRYSKERYYERQKYESNMEYSNTRNYGNREETILKRNNYERDNRGRMEGYSNGDISPFRRNNYERGTNFNRMKNFSSDDKSPFRKNNYERDTSDDFRNYPKRDESPFSRSNDYDRDFSYNSRKYNRDDSPINHRNAYEGNNMNNYHRRNESPINLRSGYESSHRDNRHFERSKFNESSFNRKNNNEDERSQYRNCEYQSKNTSRFRDHSYGDKFSSNRDNRQEFDDITNDYKRSMNLNDDTYSSRNVTYGIKSDKIDKDNEEHAGPKRATYVPKDDEEDDYKLHVNSGINFDNYDKIPVELAGDDAPESIKSFNDLRLSEFLMKNIRTLKYKKLTPVQKYAIPIIYSLRDLMACAQTGSGKTAAFLIPIIEHLNNHKIETTNTRVAFPRALILAPTRELCRQIFTVTRSLCNGSDVKSTYIYGGIEMNKSRRNILEGCDIVVATPGRLVHFLELSWISFRYLKFFVLDEADRMLESDGFYESVNKIYNDAKNCGDDRRIQISMFSATFPNEIQTFAKNLLNNYLFLAVGVVGSANSDVKQEIIQSEPREKLNAAIEYIKNIPHEKTLIFVDTKRMADFFGIKLGYLGFKTTTIHGDREQEQREIALNDFKKDKVNFMVATNVAARGLDIPKVDNVINIDLPTDIDTYIHRIGRTGRCGNVGRAISFFDETKDMALAAGLVAKLEEANQECPDWLKSLCSGLRKPTNYNYTSKDTRKNVKVNRFIDNKNDDFMRGTNIDYDDAGHNTSEWIED